MLFIINKKSSKNNWGENNLLSEYYSQGVAGLQGEILSRSGAGCCVS